MVLAQWYTPHYNYLCFKTYLVFLYFSLIILSFVYRFKQKERYLLSYTKKRLKFAKIFEKVNYKDKWTNTYHFIEKNKRELTEKSVMWNKPMTRRDCGHDNEKRTEGGKKKEENFRMQKQVGINRSSSEKFSSLYCNGCSSSGKVSSLVQTPSSFNVNVGSLSCNLSSSHVKVGGLKLSMWGHLRVWRVVGVVLLATIVGGSEFPERECCDPVYPPNTATTAAAPVTPPVSKSAGEFFVLFIVVFVLP